jgi:hypothetical protein
MTIIVNLAFPNRSERNSFLFGFRNNLFTPRTNPQRLDLGYPTGGVRRIWHRIVCGTICRVGFVSVSFSSGFERELRLQQRS